LPGEGGGETCKKKKGGGGQKTERKAGTLSFSQKGGGKEKGGEEGSVTEEGVQGKQRGGGYLHLRLPGGGSSTIQDFSTSYF